MIIAHYLQYMLEDPEAMVQRSSEVLSKDGVFSINGPCVSKWYLFLRDVLGELGIKADVIEEKIAQQTEARNTFEEMLRRHFDRVEYVTLTNRWHYEDADELLQKLRETFADQEKLIKAKQSKLKAYFEERIKENGEIVIDIDSFFWHCSK